MDLAGLKIKPAEGMVAVKFVDDDDDADDATPSPTSEPVPYKGVLAMVVGVGAKVSGVKKGNIVVTRSYARDSLCVEGVHFVDSYSIVATLSE